jgi:hypothetical protein
MKLHIIDMRPFHDLHKDVFVVVGNGFLDNVLLLLLYLYIQISDLFLGFFSATIVLLSFFLERIEDGFQLCVLGSRGYLLAPSWVS